MEFVELCRRTIAIDSTPANSTGELCSFIKGLAADWGLEAEIFDGGADPARQKNIVVSRGNPSQESGLLLQAHLDTRDPGPYALWERNRSNPFHAYIHGETLYGLGAADAKLDFVCKLRALNEVQNESLKKPVYVAGTYGEDEGMEGAVRLIRQKKQFAEFCLVGKPTGMNLLNKGPGSVLVEVSLPFTDEERECRENHDRQESSSSQSKLFRGGQEPQRLGENAVFKAFDYLMQLPEGLLVLDLEGGEDPHSTPRTASVEFDVVGTLKETIVNKISHMLKSLQDVESRLQEFRDNDFHPPYSTVNLGRMRTHEDHVKFVASCRLVPGFSESSYQSVVDVLKSAAQKVRATVQITDYKKAFFVPPEDSAIQKCMAVAQDLGVEADSHCSQVTTEASVFSRLGLPSLVFGPGQPALARGPEECISLKELEKTVEFYKRVIKSFCL